MYSNYSFNDIRYGDMVRRLAKPGEAILQSLSPLDCHKWHMVSCIPDEVGELLVALADNNMDEVVEELGDIHFYLEGLCQAYELGTMEPVQIYVPPHHTTQIAVLKRASDVFTYVKNDVIYRKTQNRAQLVGLMSNLYAALLLLSHEVGLTPRGIIANNITKLSKRYQEKTYSDKAAQERKDKVETNG